MNQLPRILFADDERDLRAMLQAVIAAKNLPYRVTFAENGTAALFEYEAAKTIGDPFSLAVLDVMMTGRSGLGVAETIRQSGDWDTKIVFFTADNSRMTLARERMVKPVAIWSKPLDVLTLPERIEEALQGKA